MTKYEKDILEEIYSCTSDDECDKLRTIRVLANILLKKTPRINFMELSAFHFAFTCRGKKC